MKTSQTFSIHFWLKKAARKNNGSVPIYVRITVDGIRADLSIKRNIREEHWSPGVGRLNPRTSGARAITGSASNAKKQGRRSRCPSWKERETFWNVIQDYPHQANGYALLPVFSNRKVNQHLKTIASSIGLNKHLTFHVARHTFATTITLLNTPGDRL